MVIVIIRTETCSQVLHQIILQVCTAHEYIVCPVHIYRRHIVFQGRTGVVACPGAGYILYLQVSGYHTFQVQQPFA